MALTLKINSTSGSKWRPFLKIIITRKKTVFFGGSISTSVNYIKRPLHAKFDAFNQKCTIFSHNRLTIMDNFKNTVRLMLCICCGFDRPIRVLKQDVRVLIVVQKQHLTSANTM